MEENEWNINVKKEKFLIFLNLKKVNFMKKIKQIK